MSPVVTRHHLDASTRRMTVDDSHDPLAQVRAALLDAERLVRAVGSGRRRGAGAPDPERAELRPVQLRDGLVVQVVSRTGPRVGTRNVPVADAAALAEVVDTLVALPYRNWHVETIEQTLQLRVTKKGDPLVHSGPPPAGTRDTSHDRERERLVDPDDPLFAVLGADGDKRRQVDAFLRSTDAVLRRATRAGVLPDGPLRVVDLGCGNAYLTLAAHRYLSGLRPGTRTVGVELREDLVARSTERAALAGLDGLTFVPGTIAAADPTGELGGPPHVVLALHACDTATDEALARAVRWESPVVLAAPCCHHDVQRQLAGATPPEPYGAITRHPILRERFADVLADALRSLLLRQNGYRVEVVEFIDSAHTSRNAMIRAVRTGTPAKPEVVAEYQALILQWGVQPALERMLAARGAEDPPRATVRHLDRDEVRALAPRLLALQHAAYAVEADLIGDDRIPPLHETEQDLLAADLRWCAALDDVQVVAAIGYTVEDDVVDLDRLVVDPGRHRQGVGASLVELVVALAPRATVSTGRANRPARALYEGLGFTHEGDVEAEHGLWVSRYSRTEPTI